MFSKFSVHRIFYSAQEQWTDVDSSAITLSILRSLKSPFLVTLITYPSFQFVSICYYSQIFLKRIWSIFEVIYISDFSASVGMYVFGTATFTSFIWKMAIFIYSIVGGVTVMEVL